MNDGWGVGSKANDPAFAHTYVGKTPIGLILGEFPHSRSDNSVYARFPNGRIEDFSGHRRFTKVEVEEYNYMKESDLSGDEVRKGGTCRIYFSNQIVYEFFHRDAQRALLKAHSLIDKLNEHPAMHEILDESKPPSDRLRGRKVYYKNTPAVLGYFMPDQGCVMIHAENGWRFPQSPYDVEEGMTLDWETATQVKDDILSTNIWWWRKGSE